MQGGLRFLSGTHLCVAEVSRTKYKTGPSGLATAFCSQSETSLS